MNSIDDEKRIVQQAQQDPQRFAVLYDRYIDRIYGYALRETADAAVAEDIVSATFEKALEHLPHYRWRNTSFGAWLYKIARNEMRMYWRKQRWYVPLFDWFAGSSNVEQTAHLSHQLDELDVALSQLSKRDQEVLRLSYFEELAHAEIAEVLDCSTRNVALRLHRALKRLRKQMEKQAQEALIDVTTS
ncbi:MAG: sigma-70 family RNA polymerase sigma factor [Anaerolineales bacterium]|nr:sigma-70 family RNA polymerase sigma factor [Anaerolineales bacterium]